ncbi:hypothetical protein F5B19DRAFT_452092 [Rostrohypoxylon terebratum]|nr:hypothetical protein F5B19DRAFT_452092 [Rostrohypoxylon terebratum]
MRRATSRLFLETPICRNPNWLQLQLDLAKAIPIFKYIYTCNPSVFAFRDVITNIP